MNCLNKIHDLRQILQNNAKPTALIPTMGNLHLGHASLIEQGLLLGSVVVSIFVNPIQFNDRNDYLQYQRNIEADIEFIQKINKDIIIFAPSLEEIYPNVFATNITINSELTKCLCGLRREGHFSGVATIVTKLLNIVQPRYVIFGEKDFQQLVIIKKLVADLNLSSEIIGLPTVRAEDGLALSSRNSRLTSDARKIAPTLYKTLKAIKDLSSEYLLAAQNHLLSEGFDSVDYLEARYEDDLTLYQESNSLQKIRIFAAVFLEGVRLIDNVQHSA